MSNNAPIDSYAPEFCCILSFIADLISQSSLHQLEIRDAYGHTALWYTVWNTQHNWVKRIVEFNIWMTSQLLNAGAKLQPYSYILAEPSMCHTPHRMPVPHAPAAQYPMLAQIACRTLCIPLIDMLLHHPSRPIDIASVDDQRDEDNMTPFLRLVYAYQALPSYTDKAGAKLLMRYFMDAGADVSAVTNEQSRYGVWRIMMTAHAPDGPWWYEMHEITDALLKTHVDATGVQHEYCALIPVVFKPYRVNWNGAPAPTLLTVIRATPEGRAFIRPYLRAYQAMIVSEIDAHCMHAGGPGYSNPMDITQLVMEFTEYYDPSELYNRNN